MKTFASVLGCVLKGAGKQNPKVRRLRRHPLQWDSNLKSPEGMRLMMAKISPMLVGLATLLCVTSNVEAQLIGMDFLPGIPVLDPFDPLDADDNGVVESARGGGHFHIGTELRTFAFTAKTKTDGSTTGQFQLINRASVPEAKEHGTVTCLEVLDPVTGPPQAWIGAIITHSNIGTEGTTRNWRVVDRGEGSGSMPDLMTLAFDFGVPPADQICRTRPNLGPFFPIEEGNIQVQAAP